MKRTSLLLLILLMEFYTVSGQSTIPNQSHTILQSTLSGTVTNCVSGDPIQNVTVKAIGSQQFLAETNASGYYEMIVEDGVYNIEFILVGYDTILILDTAVVTGGSTEISVNMCGCCYNISNLTATIIDNGYLCYISWDPPMGPYEIIYEDGEADDYLIWNQPGGAVAVRFTPAGYPATAIGGRIYVGDGSFPAGGNFLGSEMAVGVIDDDGTNGLPGTILDSTIITVDNYGWVDYYGLFDVTFEDGDFYLVMWQLGNNLNSAPVGVDTDVPTTNLSYSKLPGMNTWGLSPYQDFMIRAYVDGPNPSGASKKGSKRDLTNYTIARISDFDLCVGPQSGTLTPIANPSTTDYTDFMLWNGPFAWSIKTVCEYGSSFYTYSNTVLKGNTSVTYNINICNGNNEGIVINMVTDTCVPINYQLVTNSDGITTIDYAIVGMYDISIDNNGSTIFEMDSVIINSDTTINLDIVLDNYYPQNMIVDTITNIATWDKPSDTASHTQIQSYYIYLNDNFVAQTDTNNRSYFFDSLNYGENYTACVEAHYECGVSEQDCFSWQSSFLVPPVNFQDDYVYNTNEVPLKWNPPLNYFTPDGLVSFIVYQDSIIIDTIPYEGQGPNEWINYIVESLSTGNYVFSVTAVYELSIYGLPGEFDESPMVNDTVDVIWGSILPFFEGWDNGKFNYSNWSVNDTIENWKINSTIGQPLPSVEFSWDPQLQDGYISTLTSDPMLGDMLTEGYVFIDFDIQLDNRNSTSNEKMIVEIYDGTTWFEIAEFINSESFAFTKYTYEITQYAAGNVFQIRFKATGNNSLDIIGWYIDNINIFRECEAPHNLTIDVDWYTFENPAIEICWEPPYNTGPIAEWIHWDNGENYSFVGTLSGGTFSVAARWDAEQLSAYEGTSLTKMRYVPGDGTTSIILKVWIGEDGETLIYEQDVTTSSVLNIWNEINFINPIAIDITTDLWVGYTITHTGGTFVAGTDEGPTIAGYGDMISTDGGNTWNTLSGFGINGNWNIQVLVEDIPSAKSPNPIIETKTYSSIPLKLTQGPINKNPVAAPSSASRSMQGYNIYRMEEGSDYELYDFVDYVLGQNNYCYFDTVPNVNLQNGYYYKVTSTWVSDVDNCESAPAMSLENPMEDFVYIFLEDIVDIPTVGLVKIYPNPAKDYITITSASPISNIRITNYVGQEVFNNIFDGAVIQNIITSDYETGVYIVEINAADRVIIKKVIIQ